MTKGVGFNPGGTYYRLNKTKVCLNGTYIFMYGIEGYSSGFRISVSAISRDFGRIRLLVDRMNMCGFEIMRIREIVDCFLIET